jgi:thiol-disulfide isomerase/thioredoxin
MKIEKGQVRVPEIGRVWLNSLPLSVRQLRGRVVLVDFWDYTCVNCVRTLPYVQAWHERYKDLGLTVIGVHTPEFTFAQYEANVARGVREFGLTYPIVIDSNHEIWPAFACRCWPTKFLLDREGYLRFAHFGEGSYGGCEQVIQELLREIQPVISLPEIMEPLRAEDRSGAHCYPASPELYLGHRRGRIGNISGFKEDAIHDYSHRGEVGEGYFYLNGRWVSTAEYMEAVGDAEHRICLEYSARAVNLVMAWSRTLSCEVVILLDGLPLNSRQATVDVRFRTRDELEESYIPVEQARMYALVDNQEFGTHTLELNCPAGLSAFAFTFTSCINPAASPVVACVSGTR